MLPPLFGHRFFIFLLTILWSVALQASYMDFLRFARAHGSCESEVILKPLYDHFLGSLTPSMRPFLIAIGGSPGSGKTTYRKQFLELENTHLHDMDEVMIRLSGYQDDLRAIGAKKAFEIWWPQARAIAQVLVSYAIESNFSIIYDRTCGAEGSYFDLLGAKKRGYYIRLIGLHVDKEIAKERVLKREREEGRVMTEAILNEYRARFSALWPYYLKIADEVILYESGSQIPKLIFSSKNGIQEGDIYEQFLKEGDPFYDFFLKKTIMN